MPPPYSPRGQMAKKDPRRTEILRIRVRPDEMASYKRASDIVSLDFADWVRTELMRAVNREVRTFSENAESRQKTG